MHPGSCDDTTIAWHLHQYHRVTVLNSIWISAQFRTKRGWWCTCTLFRKYYYYFVANLISSAECTIPSIFDIRINLKALCVQSAECSAAHTHCIHCYLLLCEVERNFSEIIFHAFRNVVQRSKWPTASDTLDALDSTFRNYVEMEFVLQLQLVLFCLNWTFFPFGWGRLGIWE